MIKYGMQPYIHCTEVTPEPDRATPYFTNFNVSSSIRGYYEHKYDFSNRILRSVTDPFPLLYSDINTFSFSRPFVKPAGHSTETWTEKTYFTTEQLFPTVLRRSEVIDIQAVELSPVDSALLDVEEQTKDLSQLHVKFEVLSKMDSVTSTNDLAMALNEIVDAPPENGLDLYRSTFFTQEYVHSHPAQEDGVVKLRQAIDDLVSTFYT